MVCEQPLNILQQKTLWLGAVDVAKNVENYDAPQVGNAFAQPGSTKALARKAAEEKVDCRGSQEALIHHIVKPFVALVRTGAQSLGFTADVAREAARVADSEPRQGDEFAAPATACAANSNAAMFVLARLDDHVEAPCCNHLQDGSSSVL